MCAKYAINNPCNINARESFDFLVVLKAYNNTIIYEHIPISPVIESTAKCEEPGSI